MRRSASLLIFSSSMTRCMVRRTTTRSIQSLRTAFLSQSFRRSIARDSAHGVIEDLTNLTACVDDLLANVQLVVLVRLCTARNGGLGCESAHIVVGVIGSTAERTGKTGYVAKQIVGRRAYVVCCIANLGTASSIDSRNSF